MSGKPAYDLYKKAIEQFGAAIEPLARAYEADGRVSSLLLIPYGLLLTLSISLYTFRRRIELPGIEREIRELDEFRKWNPAV
jgi:hypothetical protein